MKIKLIASIALLFSYQLIFAQNARDVLENGINLKSQSSLFFQFNDNKLKYNAGKSLEDVSNPASFISLKDSSIFIVSDQAINAYLRPLNPLNYSYESENIVINDPISEEAETSLGSMISVLDEFISNSNGTDGQRNLNFDHDKFKTLRDSINYVKNKLSDSKKTKINEIFKNLKELDFHDETETKEELKSIKDSISKVEHHFKSVSVSIDTLKNDVESYHTNSTESVFITKYIFNSLINDLNSLLEHQIKRLDKLQAAYS